jgi:hypothetical protein
VRAGAVAEPSRLSPTGPRLCYAAAVAGPQGSDPTAWLEAVATQSERYPSMDGNSTPSKSTDTYLRLLAVSARAQFRTAEALRGLTPAAPADLEPVVEEMKKQTALLTRIAVAQEHIAGQKKLNLSLL